VESNVCFVDTSAWFEFFVPGGDFSNTVRKIITNSRWKFVTTDYIASELLTLLRVRKQAARTDKIWNTLTDPNLVQLVHVAPNDFLAAYGIYSQFADKKWSFVDCVSYHLMRSRKINHTCSTDKHFRQFGIVTVLP